MIASAGEQGRGFAVVASKVRSLAHRSTAAAREIKTPIGLSVERVEAGTSVVRKAGTTIEDTVISSRRVAVCGVCGVCAVTARRWPSRAIPLTGVQLASVLLASRRPIH